MNNITDVYGLEAEEKEAPAELFDKRAPDRTSREDVKFFLCRIRYGKSSLNSSVTSTTIMCFPKDCLS